MPKSQTREAPCTIENQVPAASSRPSRVFSAGSASPATAADRHHHHRPCLADQSVRAAGQTDYEVATASAANTAPVRLADGRAGVIRPLQPADERILCSLACDSSEETLYRRCFSSVERAEAGSCATALVLEVAGHVVGVATAEDLEVGAVTAAYLLEDATRRHKVGILLLGNLAVGERRHSVGCLRAAGLDDSVCMLQVFIRAGWRLVRHHRGAVATVTLTTTSPLAPAVPRQRQQPVEHSLRPPATPTDMVGAGFAHLRSSGFE